MVAHEMPDGIKVRKSGVNWMFCKLSLLKLYVIFHTQNLYENDEKGKGVLPLSYILWALSKWKTLIVI